MDNLQTPDDLLTGSIYCVYNHAIYTRSYNNRDTMHNHLYVGRARLPFLSMLIIALVQRPSVFLCYSHPSGITKIYETHRDKKKNENIRYILLSFRFLFIFDNFAIRVYADYAHVSNTVLTLHSMYTTIQIENQVSQNPCNRKMQ